MAPKKKDEKKASSPEPIEDNTPEEEEEGEGKATFTFALSRIANLPVELETIVALAGPFRETRSGPVLSTGPAEGAPHEASGWEWEKARSIRLNGQPLWDDLLSKRFTVSVLDAGAEFALVGRATLDCSPLLHDKLEVGGEIRLELTPEYRAKWFPENANQGDALNFAPDGTTVTVTPVPDPPITTVGITVTVQDYVGPAEDRQNWIAMTLGVKGAFGFPPRLTELGVASPEEIEFHPLKYQAVLLGETVDGGALIAPKEQRPDPPEPAEPADPDANDDSKPEPVEEQLSEDEWRAQQERFECTVRFTQDKLVRYRGASFIKEFRYMLNHTGGVWFYFSPEEKPAADPKKPNAPETGNLAKHYTGKAWLELKDLINPGVCKVEKSVPLVSTSSLEETAEEPTLESSRSFVCLSLELDRGVALPESLETKIPMSQLLTSQENFNKFPASTDAADLYTEAVKRSFEAICKDFSDNGGAVQDVVEDLKQAGHYGEVKQDLRNAIVRICRERLRKDPKMVPGKPLNADASVKFFSDAYAYMKEATIDVLDVLQKENVVPPGEMEEESISSSMKPPGMSPSGTSPGRMAPSMASPVGMGGTMPSTMQSCTSPGMMTEGMGDISDPFAAALRESAAARQSREALGVAADPQERCARLAHEAEMVGNWSRAAKLFENRLLLHSNGRDPKMWIEYAKFCMRARGRQASAEEALRQAVQLLADGISVTPDVATELDLMLGCLLLDRGRHDEAVHVFRERHNLDMGNALARFLLGLAFFLADEDEDQWRPLLQAAGKPREYFDGLRDDRAVADKLRADRDTSVDPIPFAACLEKLTDFGLPSLVFTFLDQCDVLPGNVLASEPIALVDAKAAMLDKNWEAAAARLQPLLTNQGGAAASYEVWRLAGECHFQLTDTDKALHELQKALSFEKGLDDPFVFIRFGHVLLLKKRWLKARDAFLQSIHCKPTAEAWSGVGYAAQQSQEHRECYEALREANLLDNERTDVWAQLCLIHLRYQSTDLAVHCFRQCVKFEPDSDEMLLDIAGECIRRDILPEVAAAAAQLACQLRESGQGHSLIAEAFAKGGELEKGVYEAQVAIRQLADRPDERKVILERALKWAEELGDATLADSLNDVQRSADQQEAERAQSRSP